MTSDHPPRPRAVFIGPMAAGKTRLGKRVARLLDVPFHDTDRMVVADHGDIPAIFESYGEGTFRAFEREAVVSALSRDGVVSLGGGSILDEHTRADLANLPVVYVHVTPEAVASRLKPSTRPLLTEGVEGWSRIFEQRRHIYETLADIDFDTSHAHLGDIAETIVAWVRSHEGN